jgi:hypothetical protein
MAAWISRMPCSRKAESDRTARDALRVRIKAARDRILFRPPPRGRARIPRR